jgi:putative cardiolipin synthase
MSVARPFRLLLSLTAALLLISCVSAPLNYPKEQSTALVNAGQTAVARGAAEWLGGDLASPDVSGFYPLTEGFDAFAARLALIEEAETSVDAQYFLMKADAAGLVFSNALYRAADRGVRVRLLLDDVFTSASDDGLYLLTEHPNIEVRIFNPISHKGIYAFNYLGNFKLANRRMHNKSFTVDSSVSIIGGRNIAVEYFQLETTGEFIDFDMLSAGPIVQEVSASFDDYWNDELAVPVEGLVKKVNAQKLAALGAQLDGAVDSEGNAIYAAAADTDLLKQFSEGKIPAYLATAQLTVDDPQKLREKIADEHQKVITDIAAAMSAAEQEIIIYTPYLIPGKSGVEFIRGITEQGVRVIIVTNSLATNNHTAVHSAYASYRKDLLKAGVELWEARANAAEYINDDGEKELEQLTLHAKGMLIDRRTVFVGSLNLDPRSISINTEMGALIDSQALATAMAEGLLASLPEMAYRLELSDKNKITWHGVIDGEEVVETKEPLTSRWTRFKAWFLKIVPEKQL